MRQQVEPGRTIAIQTSNVTVKRQWKASLVRKMVTSSIRSKPYEGIHLVFRQSGSVYQHQSDF
ncbi:hypothetical protein IX91_22655 [Vibrio tubiashii ATCC 19109]|uniref:Uncharacterized protein n=1 Tax=Vibrio tubiashii ATCC 19109 TaxID=1051646 RepID=A0A0A0SRF2_9VIBR|nr:hypothetical protein IX91_22655 [Vibrio tubiashii ATCC 19109]